MMMLREQIIVLSKYVLFILIRCRYAINFLLSISLDLRNHNFNYFIKIVLIKSYSIKQDYNRTITIKAKQIKISSKACFLQLSKINYLKISIDLRYQISQMRSLRNNFLFVLFKTIIIKINLIVLRNDSNNKLAHIMKKRTRTKFLIKTLIIRSKTIRKARNTITRTILQKN